MKSAKFLPDLHFKTNCVERKRGRIGREERIKSRRRGVLSDAGSRNPSRSSVGVEEEEREEVEV